MKKFLIFLNLMFLLLLSMSFSFSETSSLDGIPYREMVTVNGGTYTQKTIDVVRSISEFEHTISSFEIGKYEVTYELWYTVYQWAINNGYSFANSGREGSQDSNYGASPSSSKKYEPVTYVNWRDCIVWCNAYSQMAGKTPVYTNSSGDVIKDSRDSNGSVCDSAYCNWSADGYRLPTEGEWQYAASNRGSTSWNYASGASDSCENSFENSVVAWYYDNSGGKTHKVGTKSPNGLGIYDMSGNLYERCWDWDESYPTSSQTNYRGPASGSSRMGRGGSWYTKADFLMLGFRSTGTYPDGDGSDFGFRIARSL